MIHTSACAALPPLAALAADFPEANVSDDDPVLGGWLSVGLCFWRIAQIDESERAHSFHTAALVLEDAHIGGPVEPRASSIGIDSSAAGSLATVIALFAEPRETGDVREWASRLRRAVQDGAEHLERTGAFHLAYSLLTSFRAAVASLGTNDLGRVIVQQARIARQLGAIQTAEDHYRLAEQLSRRTREPDLRIRAVIGRGVMAATRGNYPAARKLFEQALRAARAAELADHENAAHNALLMAAVAAKDVDSALLHGWHLFRHAPNVPERKAEVLVNLAEVALLAGYGESALAASMMALDLTKVDRVLLAAFGTAAAAGARLGRRDQVDRLAIAALIIVGRSRQDFDRAYALLEFAEAYATLGLTEKARQFLAQAQEIAVPRQFYEIVHRAETLDGRLIAPDREQVMTVPAPLPSAVGALPHSQDSWRNGAEGHTDRNGSELTLSVGAHRVLEALAGLRA